jgi:long-chain acyl-CoA synthetase
MKKYSYPLYEIRTITDIKDLLIQSVKLYADLPAFWVRPMKNRPYTPITFSQLYQDVREMSAALSKMGMSNKKVAIISENRYEWAFSYLAAVICAGMVVPLDRDLPFEDIQSLLNAAEAGCVIYSSKFSDCLMEWNDTQKTPAVLINMDIAEDNENELSIRRVLENGNSLIAAGDSSFEDVVIDPSEARILIFTSGTIAKPKGVLLSHGNIVTNLMDMCQMIYIDENDIFMSVLPLHHTYECTCGFLCQIYRGSSIAYCDGLKYILSNIKEVGATVMLGVPAIFETMYRRLWSVVSKDGMERKLKTGLKISGLARRFGIDVRRKLFADIHKSFGGKLRLFISGAAAVDPEVSRGFRDLGISFLQGYGITECSPIVAANRDKQYKDHAAGMAVPRVEIKLINKNADNVGEITCRGDNVMIGYYRDGIATNAAFEDGWFKTGDLGVMDKDGFLTITGREKNVIVMKNGKNVYPEELEFFVARHQEIAECMVYGEYAEKHQETQLCIQILPNYEYIQETYGDKQPEEIQKIIENIVSKVNKRNVRYKYIRNVYLRDNEFIKTTTRKIKRYAQIPLQPK